MSIHPLVHGRLFCLLAFQMLPYYQKEAEGKSATRNSAAPSVDSDSDSDDGDIKTLMAKHRNIDNINSFLPSACYSVLSMLLTQYLSFLILMLSLSQKTSVTKKLILCLQIQVQKTNPERTLTTTAQPIKHLPSLLSFLVFLNLTVGLTEMSRMCKDLS